MILDYYCELEKIDVNDLYNDGNKFVSIRDSIQDDLSLIEDIADNLVDKFDSIINEE